MAQNSMGTAKKRPRGRPFPKGVSGNPGGRPKSERAYLVEQHGEAGEKVYERLMAIRDASDTPAKLKAEIDMFILERMNGKAPQSIAVTGEGGGPVVERVEFVVLNG